jgi:hypothetical protein
MTRLVSLLALAALGALAAPAAAQTPLVATRVGGSGPVTDPAAAVWRDARAVKVGMLPQTVALPHKPDAAIKELSVRAVHNGGWIAFLLEWKDRTRSDKVILDNFGDQVAIQLPVDIKGATPSPMMGNPGGRVNIMQWRAAFQKDIDDGHPPTIGELYPYAWTDVYPDELLGSTDARAYTGALGVENPISRGRASPVLDQMAEGWGSMTVKPDQHAQGKGVWKNGQWSVTITRPMVSDDINAPRLTAGDRTVISFAAWEGGNREVGARKSWAPWMPLVIGGPAAPRPRR